MSKPRKVRARLANVHARTRATHRPVTLRRARGDSGVTLIELLIVISVTPLLVGAIAVALIAVLTQEKTVTNRIGASGDTQIVSANYVNDVQGGSLVTTNPASTNPAPCGAGTQVLGVLNPFGTEISYMVVPAAHGTFDLVRNVCQGGNTTPVHSSVVTHNVQLGNVFATVGGVTGADSGWVTATGVSTVTLKVTEGPNTQSYTFSLAATPRVWSPQPGSGGGGGGGGGGGTGPSCPSNTTEIGEIVHSSSPAVTTPVTSGQTVSVTYQDDDFKALGNGTNGGPAPGLFVNGIQQPASSLNLNHLPGSDNAVVLSYTVPANTPDGTSIEMIFYDSDGWTAADLASGTFPTIGGGTAGCATMVWSTPDPNSTTGTLTGTFYQCVNSSPTTTNVDGGTLSATGPTTVSPFTPGPPPDGVATVNPGTYFVTASAPQGDTLDACGQANTNVFNNDLSATQTAQITATNTTNVVFYVDVPPPPST